MRQDLASHPSKRYYPNASIPPPLDIPGLFNPDANSPMWMDTSLNDHDETHVPPAYLANPKVQEGILGWLGLQRCQEEESRILGEMDGLLGWMSSQIDTINQALNICKGSPLLSTIRTQVYWLTRLLRPSARISTWDPASNASDYGNQMDAGFR